MQAALFQVPKAKQEVADRPLAELAESLVKISQ